MVPHHMQYMMVVYYFMNMKRAKWASLFMLSSARADLIVNLSTTDFMRKSSIFTLKILQDCILKISIHQVFFSGRKAIEGAVLGMMIQSPPPRSHGTMPLDVRRLHEFGYFCLRRITKYLEHRGAPMNYPLTDKVGEILVKMHGDLRLCLQMYSPTHGRTSR